MTEYLLLTPLGSTYHIASPRRKRIGPIERQTTYCGLYVLAHSLMVTQDEAPERLCKVCRKRSQA